MLEGENEECMQIKNGSHMQSPLLKTGRPVTSILHSFQRDEVYVIHGAGDTNLLNTTDLVNLNVYNQEETSYSIQFHLIENSNSPSQSQDGPTNMLFDSLVILLS